MSQLFKEKRATSPFKMDMSRILPKLQEELYQRRYSLKKGVVYSKGAIYREDFILTTAWMDIERFNGICKREFGVQLLWF